MMDFSSLGSDIVETVKEEVKAVGKSARGQIIPSKKGKEPQKDHRLQDLKGKEKIKRQKLLDAKIAELSELRRVDQITAPAEKPLLSSPTIPQLKRTEGWQTEVARHRQEVGVSKGKG